VWRSSVHNPEHLDMTEPASAHVQMQLDMFKLFGSRLQVQLLPSRRGAAQCACNGSGKARRVAMHCSLEQPRAAMQAPKPSL
jgi:hypothetical protein